MDERRVRTRALARRSVDMGDGWDRPRSALEPRARVRATSSNANDDDDIRFQHSPSRSSMRISNGVRTTKEGKDASEAGESRGAEERARV